MGPFMTTNTITASSGTGGARGYGNTNGVTWPGPLTCGAD